MSESYVTIATDDISCIGCLVLCNSLKQTGTERKLSVLVTVDVSEHLRSVLRKFFDYVFYTKDLFLLNKSDNSLEKFEQNEKLKCWLLSQFRKCIFLESDVLIVENIDDLFERSELSAASDPRWPDYFDAGVFVYEPSLLTYSSLIDFSSENKFQNNSIQCLLNSFFSKWSILDINNKIPFTYNCQLNYTFYTHTNALLHFGRNIKVARLGNSVIQMMQPSTLHDANYDQWNKLWLYWWKIFNEMVKPSLVDNKMRQFNRFSYDKSDSQNTKENRVDINNSRLEISDQYPKFNTISGNINPTDVQENTEIKFNMEIKNPSEKNCYSQVHDSTKAQYDTIIEDNLIIPDKPDVTFYSDIKNYQSLVETKESNDLEENIEVIMHQTELVDEIRHCDLPNFEDIGNIANENLQQGISVEVVSSEDTGFIIPSVEDKEERDKDHRQQWERGEIDYMGKDSFQNILLQLNSFITQKQNNSKVEPEE